MSAEFEIFSQLKKFGSKVCVFEEKNCRFAVY